MTNLQLPTMVSGSYASTSTALGVLGGEALGIQTDDAFKALRYQARRLPLEGAAKEIKPQEDNRILPMASTARRLVKVVIVDPNENIPLDKCVLYSGDEKVTDATDQELFFEIDIKSVLEEYNKFRTTVVDKKVKERTEKLEAAKIRDLKMVVVTIAQF